MTSLVDSLSGGDRRMIGRSNAVVREVLGHPEAFTEIIRGLSVDDLLIRMRCADVAEKVSRDHPEWLLPHKAALLRLAGATTQQELRWHLAQMLPRLELASEEKRDVVAMMFAYLSDKSRIVKTFAMQALADFAEDDPALRAKLLPLLGHFERTGSPAMRSRARRLKARLRERERAPAP